MIYKNPTQCRQAYTQNLFGKPHQASARQSQTLSFIKGNTSSFSPLHATMLSRLSVPMASHRFKAFPPATPRIHCSSQRSPANFPIIPSLYVQPPLLALCCKFIQAPDFAQFGIKNADITSPTLIAFYDYLDAECALEKLATTIIDSSKRQDFKNKHATAFKALHQLKEFFIAWPTNTVATLLDEIDKRLSLLKAAMDAIEDIDCINRKSNYRALKVFIYLNKEPNSIFDQIWDSCLERLLIYYLILDALCDIDAETYREERDACSQRILQHTKNLSAHRSLNALTQRSLDASIAALQNLPQVPKQPSVEKPHVPSLYLHVPLIDFACRLIPSPAFGEFNVSNESTVSAALMAFYDYLDAEYALKALASRVAKPAQRNDFKQKHAEALDALRRLKSALENGELPEEDKTIVEIEHRIQVLEHAMKALEDIDCFHLQCDSFSLKVLISANKQANSIFESTWDTALEQLFIHYFIVNSLYRADPLFYKEELCTYIQRSLQHIEHRTAHRAWNSITRSALKASVVYFNDTMESSSFR